MTDHLPPPESASTDTASPEQHASAKQTVSNTPIIRTETFDLAYRFVTETNLNIFLTGKAGTGKTTFLKFLRANSAKKMVVAAPTGVAAINAGGITLHSLFQLPFAPFIPSPTRNGEAVTRHSLLSKVHFHREKLNLFRSLELLVIDEASMVASYTVDAIDTILRSVRRRHSQPFGGVQLLFIGDLHQLQPVVKREEWHFLKDYYSSIFFFDSLVLKENVPVMIELKEIFRQKDNSFIEILNQIRHNNLTEENYTFLSSRLRPGFSPGEKDGYVTLTTHNNQADAINEKKLAELPSKTFEFRAGITGDFPEHMYPSEQKMILKKGAQVMFIKNDVEKQYFNGKTGIISYLSDNEIKVRCGKEEDITVKKYEWENVNYSLDPETREIKETVTGVFEQYPLRLAWAITIHKSQGLTFDKVVIDTENAFANGQVYVALSRCTSLEGLVLTSPVNRKFLGAHQDLKDWQDKHQKEKDLHRELIIARSKYTLSQLQEIFNWKSLIYELNRLHRLIFENQEQLPKECVEWIKKINQELFSLDEVAKKFTRHILALSTQNFDVEKNPNLQQRVKDAAKYFSTEFLKWKEQLYKHPLSADTKKIARPLDASLDDISYLFSETLNKINYCKEGFMLSDYMDVLKNPFPRQIIRSCYMGKKKISGGSPPIQNELYKKIAALRKKLADSAGESAFKIFSNKTIYNICEKLPADKDSLLAVNGFGKYKVDQYGDEIIEAVQKFCSENNLVPQHLTKEQVIKVKQANHSLLQTIKLVREGKNIEQIAKERNFAVSTIESHLEKAIRIKLIKIEEVLSPEEISRITAAIYDKPESSIVTGIKEKIPEIGYGRIRMVLSSFSKENKNV